MRQHATPSAPVLAKNRHSSTLNQRHGADTAPIQRRLNTMLAKHEFQGFYA